MLAPLRANGTERDTADNRRFFFDQYAALLLFYFFNPIITSLNGLQKVSGLEKVQKVTGSTGVSKGSLSEAQGVFDPALLEAALSTWAGKWFR